MCMSHGKDKHIFQNLDLFHLLSKNVCGLEETPAQQFPTKAYFSVTKNCPVTESEINLHSKTSLFLNTR